MKTPPPIHALLIAVFPVLFLFAHNVQRFSIQVVLLPLLAAAGLGLLCYVVLRVVLGEPTRAGFLATISLLLFFSYGHLVNLLRNSFIALCTLALGPNRILSLILAAIFLAALVLVVRRRRPLVNLTVYLNVVAVLLVALSLFNIAMHPPGPTRDRERAPRPEPDVPPAVSERIAAIGGLPDIYYIILDGYGRADILQDLYAYDDSDFVTFLTDRGFHVVGAARSNYDQTALSVASALNFTYLDDLAARLGVASDNRRPLWDLIRDSRARNFLADQGYRFAAFATGYTATECRGADIYLSPRWSLDEFQNAVLTSTPVPAVLKILGRSFQHGWHRERIRFTFDHLGDPLPGEGPVFVFAHVVGPHPPFVFGPQGESVRTPGVFTMADGTDLIGPEGITREEYVALYRDQLHFINRQARAAIDAILEQASRPVIIVLQGDHGPGSRMDWEEIARCDVRERMSILNALYLPDHPYGDLPGEITPVNTFRVLFNLYFGTDHELLPDRSFYSTSSHPYEFTDVTAEVRGDADR